MEINHSHIVLDACCMLNFCASGHFIEILKSIPAQMVVTEVVRDKELITLQSLKDFVVEVIPEVIPAKNQSIGIDLGIKTFAFMSNGEKAESPSYAKLDRKVRKMQRKLARQVKGSKRRDRTRFRIAKTHNQIADTRKDFLHKLSTKIVRENQSIVLEDLNVSGMVKNRKLSRAISLQGWRAFRTLCEAKSAKFDREFHVISRWEPTSQVCSDCGFKWGKLDLSVRTVTCISCGSEHDRDENAAKNIEKVGVGHIHDSKCMGRAGKTTLVAQPVEPSTQVEVVQLTLFAC
jgi:putative transposase